MCLAIPGRVIEVNKADELLRQGRVDFGGVIKNVSLACVPEATVGRYVLVHAGMAISIVDEAEAGRVFEFLDQMGELTELDANTS
jgi:hydrogenase expression/formation protein HypC